MTDELVLWQVRDERNGCVFPWLTHPFLEVLKTWDLKETNVLEYGGGRSTAWWATEAAQLVTVEANDAYVRSIAEELMQKKLLNKAIILSRITNEGTTDPALVDYYVNAPDSVFISKNYGIVVVDGIMRHECMVKALEILGKTGGKLIADNWQQDGFVCPASEELMKPYEIHAYVQEDHTDNHGRKWCTAYWEIPKEKLPA